VLSGSHAARLVPLAEVLGYAQTFGGAVRRRKAFALFIENFF